MGVGVPTEDALGWRYAWPPDEGAEWQGASFRSAEAMAHSADHRRALTVSDRLISSLARASARKRAYKADETSAETSTEHVVQAHMMRLPPSLSAGRQEATSTSAPAQSSPGAGSGRRSATTAEHPNAMPGA